MKNRHKDFVHHFGNLQLDAAPGHHEDGIACPDPAWLFESILPKLPVMDFSHRAQGAWIQSNIAQGKRRLHAYFDTLDASRLHFAVISAGEDRAYILARTPEIRTFVQNYFHLVHHEHCIREE